MGKREEDGKHAPPVCCRTQVWRGKMNRSGGVLQVSARKGWRMKNRKQVNKGGENRVNTFS